MFCTDFHYQQISTSPAIKSSSRIANEKPRHEKEHKQLVPKLQKKLSGNKNSNKDNGKINYIFVYIKLFVILEYFCYTVTRC